MITILGSGESGMGAALLASSKGYDVLVSDFGAISPKNIKTLKAHNISFEKNGHSLEKMEGSQLVVKSPGIPEDAPIIKSLKVLNIPVVSEIEFAAQYTTAKFIAITGSNGKTTTTLLTYHLLLRAGLKVGVAGNVGNSLSKLVLEDNYDLIVLELSSFQLDGVYKFKADTSVLLNITADHLDRYNYNIEEYADAKMRIVQNQDESNLLIYNSDDALTLKKLDPKKEKFESAGISINEQGENKAYLLKDELIFRSENKEYGISTKELPLIGKHNYYNTMAAVLVSLRYGLDFDNIVDGLADFKNAPHRLEFVADVEGVRFINDSKATNVDSVYYALEGIDRRIVWVAGGVNKGNEYGVIRKLVEEKVKALICLGTDNKHLLDAFGRSVEVIKETFNVIDAVEEAFTLANPGDVVLLSPACASFDLFENYEHRGQEFKNAVLKLKKKSEQELVI